jgi:hypothetical protein
LFSTFHICFCYAGLPSHKQLIKHYLYFPKWQKSHQFILFPISFSDEQLTFPITQKPGKTEKQHSKSETVIMLRRIYKVDISQWLNFGQYTLHMQGKMLGMGVGLGRVMSDCEV